MGRLPINWCRISSINSINFPGCSCKLVMYVDKLNRSHTTSGQESTNKNVSEVTQYQDIELHCISSRSWTTHDGRNPAPVDKQFIPLFTGFYTSQVVQDFFHQQYDQTVTIPKEGALDNEGVQPGRLIWNLQITHLESKMIFQTSIITFHVNLQEIPQLLEK